MGLARRIALASLLVGGAVLSLLAGADPFLLLSEVPFAAVGAVLVIRRPGNTIGWLLIAVAAFATLSAVQLDVPVGPLVAGTAPLPERTFAWLTAVIGFLILPSYALLALIFPSGRVPGGRWGRAVRVLIALNVILVVGIAVGPTVSPTMIDGSTIDAANPFALLPASSWWDGFSGLTSVVIFLTAIVAIGSFVLRLRTARGLERQQLRWVVASLVLSGVAVAVALFTGAWGLAFIAFATIPIAIGIAVLRYRLYDVDRLISRTLGYGALAAMLAAAYVGSVLLLSALLAPFTSANSLVVAGSTLLVAALFAPVRRRVQSIVDRRFDRTRYDGARELADLSQRLRSEVDLDGVKAEVVATIGRTLQPVSVSVWLIGRSDPAGSQPEPSSAWATTRSSM
jgi:hypothetical protein